MSTPESTGTLQRFDLTYAAGSGMPSHAPMDDGYWTPWHLAQRELAHEIDMGAQAALMCQVYKDRLDEAQRETERLRVLAKEATNGWACYARTKVEHQEIARLHDAIDQTPQSPQMADYDQIRQILAADMTSPDGALPEPRQQLGELATCVYDLANECRGYATGGTGPLTP